MSDPTVLSPEAAELLRAYRDAKAAPANGDTMFHRHVVGERAMALANRLIAENAQTAEDAAMPPPEFFELVDPGPSRWPFLTARWIGGGPHAEQKNGRAIKIPLSSASALQSPLGWYIGSLQTFALRAHRDAKPADILAVFRNMVPKLADQQRQKAAAHA